MKVSIITITRNNAAALQRTILSVEAQTHLDIEHIVVDGLSSDDTDNILLDHPNIKVIKRSPQGVYDAINHGIEASSGYIVGLLHAGDVYSTNNIVEQVVQRFQHTGCHYLFGDIRFVNPHSGKTLRSYRGNSFSLKALTMGIAPPHPSLWIIGQIARQPHWRYDASYRIAGDFQMFARLISNPQLKSEYLPCAMVDMEPGGLASKWRNRIFVNNREKLRALRSCSLKASPLTLLLRYPLTLKSYLTTK